MSERTDLVYVLTINDRPWRAYRTREAARAAFEAEDERFDGFNKASEEWTRRYVAAQSKWKSEERIRLDRADIGDGSVIGTPWCDTEICRELDAESRQMRQRFSVKTMVDPSLIGVVELEVRE